MTSVELRKDICEICVNNGRVFGEFVVHMLRNTLENADEITVITDNMCAILNSIITYGDKHSLNVVFKSNTTSASSTIEMFVGNLKVIAALVPPTIYVNIDCLVYHRNGFMVHEGYKFGAFKEIYTMIIDKEFAPLIGAKEHARSITLIKDGWRSVQ